MKYSGLYTFDEDTHKYIPISSIKEEVYEEPKVYWTVGHGVVSKCTWDGDKYDRDIESVGLKFDTEEECKRAIEKLKAWKRLRDKGFRFTDYDVAEPVGDGEFCGQAFFRGGNYGRYEIRADLDLLFGGEE